MNNIPRVSICVPNLNKRPYLPERFETIFSQTLADWELIVVDSYSNDGSWEYISNLAGQEPRMRISKAPRGLYSSWNRCIQLARGEYVYIATSDDTMAPDCLEKMVAALDDNSDCGICQCGLVTIDAESIPFPEEQQWDKYSLGSYDQNLVLRRNKRFAPHDGILHPALFTIYTSITQLLIRRKVFEKVGFFDGRWGSISDFEWEMRAGLVENCIYIPEKLADWRIHPQQATQDPHTLNSRLKMIEMARAAFETANHCDGSPLKAIDIEDLLYFLERDVVAMECGEAKGIIRKFGALLRQLLIRPRITRDHIIERIHGNRWGWGNCPSRYRRLRELLQKYDVRSPIFE